MKNVQYPRACAKRGTVIRDQGNYSWHVRRCGTDAHRVTCPFCPITFARMDICKRHATFIDFLFLGFYYQPILRLELLRSSTIPTMDESEQHGGEIKKEGTKAENTALKKEETEPLRKRRKK